MNEELAVPEEERELLQPFTGELVRVSDLDKIGVTLRDLREFQQQIKDAIAAFSEPLLFEARRRGTRTLHLRDLTLEVSADYKTEWDVEVLGGLLEAGLPEERYNELVRPEVTYKVDGRVARQLESNPDYAKIIEDARIKIPKTQYVNEK